MSIIFILPTLMWAVLAQNFNLSLAEQYLVHQKRIGILAMGKTLQSNILVSYENGEVREYASDFSAYKAVSASQAIEKLQATQLILSTTLSNGRFLNLTDRKLVFTSNNFTRIKALNYYTYAEERTLSLNQTILESFAFPINVLNNSQSVFVLACNHSVVVAFRGDEKHYSYENIFLLGGALCTSAKNSLQQITSNGSQLTTKVTLFVAVSKQVYRLTATLKFSFNSTIDHFDLESTSFTYLPIYLSLFPVSSLFIANGLLLVQSDNLGLKTTTIYNLNTSLVGVAVGLPLDQTIAFFYIYNAFYILQKTGLVKLSYSSVLNTISVNAVMTTLPFNAYGLILNSPLDAFFIRGFPFLYKAGLCEGQSSNKGNVCVPYSCSDSSCSSCPIYPTLCSNSIQAQQYSVNFTSNQNSSNTQINPQQSSNSTQEAHYFQSNSFEQSVLEYLMQIIKKLMSIPGARRVVSPFFYYFGVFDDLFFYQFHDRVYGETMNYVFDNLNDIQTHKWSIVDSEKVLALAKIDFASFENKTDYQRQYGYYQFKDNLRVVSEGVWGNLTNFFIVGLPSIILAFILGRTLFNCLFEYPLSKVFRKFGFWWYLPLLIFEGNIEEFVFFQCTEWKNTFFFDSGTKIVKLQTILFGFCTILVSVSLYFVSCALYRRFREYLMDNSEGTLVGQFSLTVQFGAKNLCFGLMHSFLRNIGYRKMVLVLLGSEAVFTLLFVYFVTQKAYKNLLKVWLFIFLNFMKMVLVTTMAIDYQMVDIQAIQLAQQACLKILGIVFIVILILQTYQTLKEIYNLLIQIFFKEKNPANKRLKEKHIKLKLYQSQNQSKITQIDLQKHTNPKSQRKV